MEKEKHNGVGTPLDLHQKHDVATVLVSGRKIDVENMTLYQRYILVGAKTLERQCFDNVASTLFDVATKRQPKTNVVTTSCDSWVGSCFMDGAAIFWLSYFTEVSVSLL